MFIVRFYKAICGVAISVFLSVLLPNSGYAAFSFDQVLPDLTTQFYTTPAVGARQHSLNAGYAIPNSMVVPTLQPASSLRLKILLPPGVSQAAIRGESNDWIGSAGQQPVIAVVDAEVTENTCPLAQSGAFTCNGQIMEPPSGGLSSFLYLGTPLSQPRYVNFVLHNPGTATFSFATLTISMEISSINAYTAWLNKRPWFATGNAGSQDGLTDTPVTTIPVSARCDLTETNVLATLDNAVGNPFSINIPRLKKDGLPDMAVKMIQITDPQKPERILFKFSDIQWLTCGQSVFN